MSDVEGNIEYVWLNSVFEKELNRNKTDFDIKILSNKPAVSKGENYLSEVTRVQIEVTIKNETANNPLPKIYNLIIKTSIEQIAEIQNMQVFETEMEYYNNVAPNINKMDQTLQISPKCYLADTIGAKQIIILDDMSAQGYKMADRLVGLDLEHCKIFFRKIAAFHALTATYYERNKVAPCFQQSSFSEEKRPLHKKWIEVCFEGFMDVFQEYDSLKQYAEVVKTWGNDTIFDTAQEATKANPNGFNVLNHADTWINNILFQYDENKNPVDIRMVDFQITNYGSPVFDIFCFFMTSPNLEVREKHFDELIRVYHEHLVAHLKRHKFSNAIPTLRQLHIEIIKKGFLGSSFIIGFMPIVLLDPKNAVPFDKLMERSEYGDKVRHNFFHNPRFVRTLEVAMKFLHNRGLLVV